MIIFCLPLFYHQPYQAREVLFFYFNKMTKEKGGGNQQTEFKCQFNFNCATTNVAPMLVAPMCVLHKLKATKIPDQFYPFK